MKWQSKKQAAMYRQHAAARNHYLSHQLRCAFCRRYGELSVHEIVGGSYRTLTFPNPAFWLPACGVCNCDVATDHEIWSWARQFAVKAEIDSGHFDMAEVDRVMSPRRIDWAAVLGWVVQHKREGDIAA